MADRQYRGYGVNMRLTDVADTFEQNQEVARRSDKVAGVFCRQNYFSRNRQSKLLN